MTVDCERTQAPEIKCFGRLAWPQLSLRDTLLRSIGSNNIFAVFLLESVDVANELIRVKSDIVHCTTNYETTGHATHARIRVKRV